MISQGHLSLQMRLLAELSPGLLERLRPIVYPGLAVPDWTRFQELFPQKKYLVLETQQGVLEYSLRLLARLDDRCWLRKLYTPSVQSQTYYVLEGAVEGNHLGLVKAVVARVEPAGIYTFIELSAYRGYLEMTQYLLSLDSPDQPEAPTRAQILRWSLDAALVGRQLEMVSLLLDHGASVSEPALHELLFGEPKPQDLPLLELILDKSGVGYGQVLVMAARAGRLEMVQTIIRKANSHIYLLPDYTRAAVETRNPAVVAFLLDNLEHPPAGEFDQANLETRLRIARALRLRLGLLLE